MKYSSIFFRLFIQCIFCTYCSKVTNGCNCLFCVFISFSTLHVSGSHKPIIRGNSSCFLYTTIWFMQCLCCSSACACGLRGLRVLVDCVDCVCLWTAWTACACGLENYHDKSVHKHTQMSNINTA